MNYYSNYDRFGAELGESAEFLRSIALEIDSNPDAISKYLLHPVIQRLILNNQKTCSDRVRLYEALAYGDAGVFLACPGASLAGVIVDEIGDERQREFFYQHLITQKARTFLAVTEPEYGSNLDFLTTQLLASTRGDLRLNGEKWLVGHGATGSIGVVIVRVANGPLGVRALLLTPDQLEKYTIQRSVLPMVGLRGARLGGIQFANHLVEPDHLLGQHLPVIRRGLMTLIKTFNLMRPCIGAMAVGTAQAVVDYFYLHASVLHEFQRKKLTRLTREIAIARDLIYHAARCVEQNPYDTGMSSLVKVKGTQVAEKTAKMIFDLAGKKFLIEHPLIEKWYRDSWGFEYMEGTQNIHKINTFNAYRSGAIAI